MQEEFAFPIRNDIASFPECTSSLNVTHACLKFGMGGNNGCGKKSDGSSVFDESTWCSNIPKSRHASSGFSLCECQVIVDYKFVNFETFLRHFSQECPKKEILMHSNKTLT